MIIKCPSCQTELEVTEDMIGRNVRCSICNTKFVLSLNTSVEKFPVLFPENKLSNAHEETSLSDLDLQRINQLKGVKKTFAFFKRAPLSIKFIFIYNLALPFICSALTQEKPGGGAIAYFLLASPLLYRAKFAWRSMVGLYFFCVASTLVFFTLSIFHPSDFSTCFFVASLFSLVIGAPAFIALWRHSARLWVSSR